MSRTTIRVEHLCKSYQLSHHIGRFRYKTLRDDLVNVLTAPIQRLRGSTQKQDPRRETFWALDDVSFEVKEGEVVGVIGRNGAGKSTLLKILSRITEPTRGRAEIFGRVGSLLEVGTGFHPELTGRENIFLSGAVLGMRRAEVQRRFDEIVAFAEVEKFLDTPAKHYSSGMYVRLAFAVAAHLEPEILLVDEVLAVGDAQFQKKCLGKMGQVAQSGRTVFFVSHNMAAIKKLCTRAFLMQQGKLILDASIDQAVSQYLSAVRDGIYVREWLDEHTAPKNSSSRLCRVAICDDFGNSLSEIDTDTPFNIEITFAILRERASVGFTVIFNDLENNCIFSSLSNHEPDWYGKEMPEGTYKTICKIPARWLNNVWFSIGINFFGSGYSDVIVNPEVLKVHVLDGIAVSGDYTGIFGGVLRPQLEWQTRRVAD